MITDSSTFQPYEAPPEFGLLEGQNTKLSNENILLKIALIVLGISCVFLLVREISYRNKPKENMDI